MTAVNTNPGTPAGITVRIVVLAVTVAALIAWAFNLGGCAHLPPQLTAAAAHSSAVMLDQAAAKCPDPVTPECAAEVWNVSPKDAEALLSAAQRVASKHGDGDGDGDGDGEGEEEGTGTGG